MNIIYDIYGAYLYDNQLDHKLCVFSNDRELCSIYLDWIRKENDGKITKEGLTKYFCRESSFNNVLIIEDASEFIKAKRTSVGRDTYNVCGKCENCKNWNNDKDKYDLKNCENLITDNYATYKILWDETKSGINALEWRYLHVLDNSSYSSYRICDYDNDYNIKEKRIKLIRENKLERILSIR